MKIGNRTYNLEERTLIMGILNVTPDSFSDGGKFNTLDSALRQAEVMINEGADIIDIGGESTRPGHKSVEAEEEMERVVPIIEAIKKRFDIPLSIDTYKSTVAEATIQAGADLINDVWGFKADESMAGVAAKHNVTCCLMHNRRNMDYGIFLEDVTDDLKESVKIALDAGVSKDKIIIDPGLGFAKNYEHNLYMMNNLEKLHTLGLPILLGASRKSFIGKATGQTDAASREIGTVATTVLGVMKGCKIIRVHNVAINKEACIMINKVMNQESI